MLRTLALSLPLLLHASELHGMQGEGGMPSDLDLDLLDQSDLSELENGGMGPDALAKMIERKKRRQVPQRPEKPANRNPFEAQYRSAQQSLTRSLQQLDKLGNSDSFVVELKANITAKHKHEFAHVISSYFEWETRTGRMDHSANPAPPSPPPPPSKGGKAAGKAAGKVDAIDELHHAITAHAADSKRNTTHVLHALHKVKQELKTAKESKDGSWKIFVPIIVFLSLFVAVLGWTLYVISDGYQAAQIRKRGYQAVNQRLNPNE